MATEEKTPPERKAVPAKDRVRRLGIVLLCVAAAAGAYPGYRYWRHRAIKQVERECAKRAAFGEWSELDRAAARWTALEPGNSLAWVYQAQAAQQLGDIPRAAESLGRIPLDDERGAATAVERSALLFGELNRPLEAVALCETLLKTHPNTVAAHQRLVSFYALTLQRRKMMIAARQAINEQCDSPETYVYLIGADWFRFSNGYDMNTHWLETSPESELFLVAQAAQIGISDDPTIPKSVTESKRVPKAEKAKMMSELLERFPHNSELLAHFLQAAATNGDRKKVSELLANASDEALDDNRFWSHKGWLHAELGQLKEAEAAYKKSLELHPLSWLTYQHYALVLRQMGRGGEAEQFQTVALKGKELEHKILLLPSVAEADPKLLQEILDYARMCGDKDVADHLAERLASQFGK